MEVHNLVEVLKSQTLMMPCLHIMEMKRGTSTTSQYNRYILNSMLGYIPDKEKAFKDIMADPIRSTIEAYVRIKQMDWAMELKDISKATWFEGLLRKVSTTRDYDSLYMPGIYSEGERLEFVVLMNDIYHGNLFNKDAGFVSHRSKAIVKKTMEAECEFLETRDAFTMNANLSMTDTFDTRDKK